MTENVPQTVTMETVAREAGVSRATVSLVYRGVKGPSRASIEKVLAAGSRLGYRHNAIAARLASKRTNTLGLSILDITNEVFTEIYEGVRDALADTGLKIVLTAATPGSGDELESVESLLSVRVDAALVAGSMLDDAELASLASSTPFVVVSRLVPGVDSVASDDRLGGELATRHLLELGHRRIVHLVPPVGPHYTARGRGYDEAMRAAGLQPRRAHTGFSLATAAATTTQLLRGDDRPTAVFADNDVMALGALTAAAELGLSVPRDLSVVGYDDTRAAALPGVALSSVNQQARRLGRIGAEYALDALSGAGTGAGSGSGRARSSSGSGSGSVTAASADSGSSPTPSPESVSRAQPDSPRQTLLDPSLHLRASTAPPSR
ncbi:MAG: LacI family DNA-binding transcriptional regulator [Leucobacter sp.]